MKCLREARGNNTEVDLADQVYLIDQKILFLNRHHTLDAAKSIENWVKT